MVAQPTDTVADPPAAETAPQEIPQAPITGPFDPARYLTSISGRAYLEVKYRLLWLRTEHPDAVIVSELVEHTRDDAGRGWALFRATVTLPTGGAATDWGSESSDDFGDYLEKAATKAIGRALAALGFGTQFCADLDDGAPDRPVDAPVGLSGQGSNGRGEGATERQVRALYAISQHAGLSETELVVRCQQQFGCHPEQLSRRDASRLIDALKQEQAAPAGAGTPATPAPAASAAPRPARPAPTPATGGAPAPNADRYTAFWATTRQAGWDNPSTINQISIDLYGRPVPNLRATELDDLEGALVQRRIEYDPAGKARFPAPQPAPPAGAAENGPDPAPPMPPPTTAAPATDEQPRAPGDTRVTNAQVQRLAAARAANPEAWSDAVLAQAIQDLYPGKSKASQLTTRQFEVLIDLVTGKRALMADADGVWSAVPAAIADDGRIVEPADYDRFCTEVSAAGLDLVALTTVARERYGRSLRHLTPSERRDLLQTAVAEATKLPF